MQVQSQRLRLAGVGTLVDGAWIDAGARLDAIRVSVTNRIEEVEQAWRHLSVHSAESPGHSYDFIRLWVQNRRISVQDQRYVLAELDGAPLALLPLHRKTVWDFRVFTWFPGAHAGCYAPICDYGRLATLSSTDREQLWRKMISKLRGADLAYLRAIPAEVAGQAGLFDQLGRTLETETLYRAQFPSWEVCDREQRSRSRRKHDRQQGDRLAALGAVQFEELTCPEQTQAAIATMFRQRSERFRAQGIPDCFAADNITSFYHEAAASGSGIDVRLHVLRLDGNIVAVRYNVVQGDRMFCLISSMSDDCTIQTGSPGKQCLLKVMQTVFDEGLTIFDMGAGYTDEKRHWCNVQIPLRHHYIPLNPFGWLVAGMHRAAQSLRAKAKAHAGVKATLRKLLNWRAANHDATVAPAVLVGDAAER